MKKGLKSSDSTLKTLVFVILLIPIAIYQLIKLIVQACSEASQNRKENTQLTKDDICDINLTSVDAMDGLQFEHYVAKLLRTIGYKQVVVTQASGDFGVDIIAKRATMFGLSNVKIIVHRWASERSKKYTVAQQNIKRIYRWS